MARSLADREIRPLTADEVLRMVEAGILREDERLELLGGALTEKPVKSPAHEAVKSRVLDWLAPGWTRRAYLVRVEAPLVVRDRLSLPEPDIAVVEPRDYLARHPDRALLVVEVAHSSLEIDTAIKPALYAAGGVAEYWVVDVNAHVLRVYGRLDDGIYREARDVVSGTVTPTFVSAGPLDVAALFAGLP